MADIDVGIRGRNLCAGAAVKLGWRVERQIIQPGNVGQREVQFIGGVDLDTAGQICERAGDHAVGAHRCGNELRVGIGIGVGHHRPERLDQAGGIRTHLWSANGYLRGTLGKCKIIRYAVKVDPHVGRGTLNIIIIKIEVVVKDIAGGRVHIRPDPFDGGCTRPNDDRTDVNIVGNGVVVL